MVRRIFWMAVGAGATVWAMNKANEAVHRLTPDSLSGTAARGALQLGDAARQFARDVKAGMAEREEQLRADLGLDGTAVVEPPRRRTLSGAAGAGGDRAISAAPGSPAAALPTPRGTRRTPPQTIVAKPRQRELPGSTTDRKDPH
ncbi:DUF6167 family protein [Kitasatospora cheerisanensis]|uniref:Secreted protein n=1 Tax=Kitasatospora cheerisanensis KCTC 2395 TaxID=1348663 RepID=A0A066Z3X0_9ACTN|nr:DUF6167 family protein [Kitasatospora cheerisanensis]KDN86949.1 hypothetical protein KCH_13950 [Kitasatospora cheerisanensis KCTC 2395]